MSKPKLNEPDVEQTTTTWGTTQSVSYSNYPLKNYKINFEELEEQEEQKIFKEFEALGYKYSKTQDSHQFINHEKEEVIVINSETKGYAKCDINVRLTLYITSKEHQLLNRLFKLWSWLDE